MIIKCLYLLYVYWNRECDSLLFRLYFQNIDREEFQKSVGNVCGLQPADPTTTVHILSASHLVICGSMNFDHKSKQFNNMKYSSVSVIQVKAESKALVWAVTLTFSWKIHDSQILVTKRIK